MNEKVSGKEEKARTRLFEPSKDELIERLTKANEALLRQNRQYRDLLKNLSRIAEDGYLRESVSMQATKNEH